MTSPDSGSAPDFVQRWRRLRLVLGVVGLLVVCAYAATGHWFQAAAWLGLIVVGLPILDRYLRRVLSSDIGGAEDDE